MIDAARSRSPLEMWWWSIDRTILVAILALILSGLVLSLAASPAVARAHNLQEFHFVLRQMVFLTPALLTIFALTLLNASEVRVAGAGLLAFSYALMALCLLIGPEVNGAQRWLALGPISLQPSEFMKPAFVIVASGLLARQLDRSDFPGLGLALGLYVVALGLLVLQPDFGQAVLVTAAWASLFFLAGTPLAWSLGLMAVAGVGAFSAYSFVPHVTSRVDRFLDPGSGDNFQMDQSLRAFEQGGVIGQGPGEGLVKHHLPDAHTDFIFAVAGEEFGLLACLILVALFATVVLRGLSRALASDDTFTRLAVSGLAVLFGCQALINIGVNLNLLPAKGMTLPFVSYGGSSLLAQAITIGFILALTRERVRPYALERRS